MLNHYNVLKNYSYKTLQNEWKQNKFAVGGHNKVHLCCTCTLLTDVLQQRSILQFAVHFVTREYWKKTIEEQCRTLAAFSEDSALRMFKREDWIHRMTGYPTGCLKPGHI